MAVRQFLCILFLLTALFFGGPVFGLAEEPSLYIREPAVAGSFYPASRETLSAMVDGFLAQVPEPEKPSPRGVQILIAPHAGYLYSGPTAAYGYRLLAGQSFDTVVLLGPFHRGLFKGGSVWPRGEWKTPLGSVPIDERTASALLEEKSLFANPPWPHLGEHSLETQLPFLQKTLKTFKIVPILVSDASAENTRALAEAIAGAVRGKKTLIVVSTDMSHYHPLEQARKVDEWTMRRVERFDWRLLSEGLAEGKSELCGHAAVLTALEIAKIMDVSEVKILHYGHSGEASGDLSNVVGYFAAALYEKDTSRVADALFKIARRTLEAHVKGEPILAFKAERPELLERRAVFVTLRKKSGELRGCIGSLVPTQMLYEAVRDKTIDAASHDPRFTPVSAEELDDIQMEISILGPATRVESADDIALGRHGVILSQGRRSGVFLPKVAEETGWSKEEFLSELCSQKAGLPPDCWKDPATELYVFTAEDFSEERKEAPSAQ